MAGVEIDISVLGDQIVRRRLLRFAHNVDDARPALLQVAQVLAEETEKRFASEGVVGGGKWAPLTPSTIRDRMRHGFPPGPILQRTGRLLASLVGFGGDHIERVTKDELVWGTSVPYARYHQTGTSRMPQRAPVRLSERGKRSVVREIQRHVVESA